MKAPAFLFVFRVNVWKCGNLNIYTFLYCFLIKYHILSEQLLSFAGPLAASASSSALSPPLVPKPPSRVTPLGAQAGGTNLHPSPCPALLPALETPDKAMRAPELGTPSV